MGHELFVVSHKTEFINIQGGQVNLRQPALEWCAKNISGELNIKTYFESSIDEKIKRIKKLNLDVFIDDLISILSHPMFPKGILRILYAPHQLPEFIPDIAFYESGLKLATDWQDILEIIDRHEY
jgi:hypothetical protein